MTTITFRAYRTTDYQACINIFDANCPEFFAHNERLDYEAFLHGVPNDYEVCQSGGKVCGAFGLLGVEQYESRLKWILLDPTTQGAGIGSMIMQRVIQLARKSESTSGLIPEATFRGV